MSNASASVPSAVAAAGLVGGVFVAGRPGLRELGGALYAAAGAWCAREWYRARGPAAAAGLGAVDVADTYSPQINEAFRVIQEELQTGDVQKSSNAATGIEVKRSIGGNEFTAWLAVVTFLFIYTSYSVAI